MSAPATPIYTCPGCYITTTEPVPLPGDKLGCPNCIDTFATKNNAILQEA
ncbi:MAG: hypothetical protein QOE90_930 [Thermoplasmata archaeon]|jgi:protein-arginine kinase activator protein McsA|nr:hypothetical protein [Thermoplasmata archaeon]